ILVLVDTQGQLMARRDEMRGLNEYLAHLAKCLLLASQQGHRTIGLEYGKAAAGAFLATALATDFLIGLMGKRRASFPIFFSRSFARGYDSVTRQSIGMLLHSAGATATDTLVSMTAAGTIRS